MTFNRSRSTTNYNYFINNLSLLRSNGPIKDLGILFDPKLKFDCHIHMIINKSHQLLGFINHSCSDFTDKFTLKSIYCSLIRPICEYGSIVWYPYQTGKKTRLEKVQHKFLRFISFKCSIPREPHTTYNPILSLLNLHTLEYSRISLDLCFLYKLLNGNVDCPDFLNRLTFYTPTFNTRSTNTFRSSLQVTNYANNTPCNR
ncbi:unnamed protein product [Macrosiphum euphorbiae]|uniref:RNA-directed DNA polymerase n=1 Tax=Macrosiphum euphorbiae TaxID=13131 RepID=A0AAV0XJZ3_9HEMI|nr:unnamed protein product [Macrosiphum euphorbiae]